jgi:hypothetical protein
MRNGDMNLKASYFAAGKCYSCMIPADEIEILESELEESCRALEILFDVVEFGVSTPVSPRRLLKAVDTVYNFISSGQTELTHDCRLSALILELKTFLKSTATDKVIKIVG